MGVCEESIRTNMQMNNRDMGLALLVVTIWGASFTVISLGLDGVPPMLLAAMRFALAAVPAVFFVRRPAIELRYLIGYGLLVGVGQFGCLFYAMHMGMPAGLASVVLQSQAFFTLALAAIFLRESVSTSQVTGVVVAAFGLFLIAQGGSGPGFAALPLGALLLCMAGAAFWGGSNIIVRKASVAAFQRGDSVNMFSLVVWSSLVPPIPLLVLALQLDSLQTMREAMSQIDAASILVFFYLSFCATLFGFGAWSSLLSRYPTASVAPLSLLVPVTGLLTASVVLDEHLSWLQWGGCLGVLCGLAITTLRGATHAKT